MGAWPQKVKSMIKIKRSLCTECQICMGICSWSHYGENTTKRSRIMVEADWPKIPTITVCQACKDHECVSACPHDALKWENWILLDKDQCDSCGLCVEACPVDGIHMDPITDLPMICDTCGGEFQCVAWCPTQALTRKPQER
jgi:Fe-S-cluster-containing hydrogenase component 2